MTDPALPLALQQASKFFMPKYWLDDGYWYGKPEELAMLAFIIGKANYKPSQFTRNNIIITVQRGELASSYRSLGDFVGWKKGKTETFLKKYSKAGYLRTSSRQGVLIVTVCNYDRISSLPDTREDGPQDKPRTSRGQAEDKMRTNHSNTSKTSEYSNTAGFENFWKVYPRTTDKKLALKSFIRAVKKVSPEIIQAGAEAYALQVKVTKTSSKYVKHASTWLNNECWTEDYIGEDPNDLPDPELGGVSYNQWLKNVNAGI